jgi:hypothetical protein
MSTISDVDVIECVVRYFYNVAPAEQIKDLLGKVDESYLAGWMNCYNEGFENWWGRIDDDNKQKYVQNARARYWGEIEARRTAILIDKNRNSEMLD